MKHESDNALTVAAVVKRMAAVVGVSIDSSIADTPVAVQLCIDALTKAMEPKLPGDLEGKIQECVVALFANAPLRPAVIELTTEYGKLPGRNPLALLARPEVLKRARRADRDDDDWGD